VHSGTVTATDPAGLSATAAASATVEPRPAAPGNGSGGEGAGGGGGGGGPTGGGASDGTAPRFSIAGRPLSLTSKNVIAVRVACDRAETEPCAGTLTLASAKKFGKGRRKRALALGRASFNVAPGRTATVKVKVSRRTAAQARALRRFQVKATAIARDAAGNQATRTGALTLIAQKPKKKGKR
jgi:hypothetical protein